MSSALGGLSAAKRRRGTTQTVNAPVSGKQPTFVSEQSEMNSRLIQVNPIEMLKIHEARLRRIESMEIIASGGEIVSHAQPVLFDSRVGDLMIDLDKTKKTVIDMDTLVRELKTTILTLQTLAITTSQTLENIKTEVASIKTYMVAMEMAKVSISEEKLQPVIEQGEGEGEGE